MQVIIIKDKGFRSYRKKINQGLIASTNNKNAKKIRNYLTDIVEKVLT